MTNQELSRVARNDVKTFSASMKTARWFILLASQVLIILGFWYWNHAHHPLGNRLVGDAAGQLMAWGRLAGLLAAFGILLQLILIGRVKWVERTFGLDRLSRLHHSVGFALIICLSAHPILITMGHASQAESRIWDQIRDFCLNWEGVLAAAIALAIMIVALGFSVAVVLRRVRYEVWYATHLTFYIAIALAFGHQIKVGSDFTDNRWFAAYWCALYAFTFGNLLLYRFILPLWNYFRHRFVVVRMQDESDDVTSVYIEGRNLAAFPIEAGQFMIVRFWTPGFRWEEHPFSMSCRPDGKQIRLTIKRLGDFTRRIPELKPGTPVIIDGPHGIFTARRCTLPKVLLIAGGIGITPIRALAEELIATDHDILLIYANRNRAAMVFGPELAGLVRSAEGRLRIIPVMSADKEWSGEQGHLDHNRLVRLVPDAHEREVYLCGPPPMMSALKATLLELGVRRSHLHYERFAL